MSPRRARPEHPHMGPGRSSWGGSLSSWPRPGLAWAGPHPQESGGASWHHLRAPSAVAQPGQCVGWCMCSRNVRGAHPRPGHSWPSPALAWPGILELANERTVPRSRDMSWPITGQCIRLRSRPGILPPETATGCKFVFSSSHFYHLHSQHIDFPQLLLSLKRVYSINVVRNKTLLMHSTTQTKPYKWMSRMSWLLVPFLIFSSPAAVTDGSRVSPVDEWRPGPKLPREHWGHSIYLYLYCVTRPENRCIRRPKTLDGPWEDLILMRDHDDVNDFPLTRIAASRL